MKTECKSMSEAILEFLRKEHCGKRNAVKAVDLQVRFGVTPRQIRDIVSSLRLDGEPICSDNSGYYYPATASEIQKTQALLRAQAAAMLDAAKAMEKPFNDFAAIT